jgi:hypothetical protein
VFLAYLSALGGCSALGIFLFILHKDMTWVGHLKGSIQEYIRRWWRYASPLIAYSAYATAINYADTYMIQRFYGASEQAHFALANRWSVFVLVFTSSALTIYWRELASVLAVKNINGAAQIYERFNRVLFSLVIILAFWLCMNARTLISLVVGSEYHPAIPVLMVMAFYPVQQTYGQLNGAAFLASERTSQYRDLGIAFSLPALPLTYFLLAPRTASIPGLNLGAFGAALKMVGYGLVAVQCFEWSNCRFFGISYARVFLEKVGRATVVGFGALLAFRGFGDLLHTRLGFSGIAVTFAGSVIYFSLMGACIYFWPRLVGLGPNDVESFKEFFRMR